MVDVFSKRKRSELMSRIKSKNTKLESDFLKKLSSVSHSAGYRYRKHYSKLPGKPDIAFPSKKVAVFIDGCFWHSCHVHSKIPLSNVSYWREKMSKNKKQDKKINAACRKAGWKVVRIWEHEIKKSPQKAIVRIINAIK
jgi:DNA mismatch endonuclease (patch repair protein)